MLRGRQPGVYSSRWSAEAQVRRYSAGHQRGFKTREEAEQWLFSESGQHYPFYEAFHSNTATHRISPRLDEQEDRTDVFILECDGASRGNPGPSGCGGRIWQREEDGGRGDLLPMAHYHHYCGHGTNNVAEYQALIRGLILALGLDMKHIRVLTDSQLVVKQSSGQWATQHADMAYYRDYVQALLHAFEWWELVAIPREDNWAADEMANAAIDDRSEGEVHLDVNSFDQRIDTIFEIADRVHSKFKQCGCKANVMVDW